MRGSDGRGSGAVPAGIRPDVRLQARFGGGPFLFGEEPAFSRPNVRADLYRILFFRRPGDGERKRRFVRGEPFVSERLFLSKAGANPQKGDCSRIARRFLLSSVRKRKMRRRLGPAAGSRPQSVCRGSGSGIARERDFAGTFAGFVLMLAFGPVAGSAGQRKKIAEYDIRIPFRYRSGRSLCGGGRAEAEDSRRESVQVWVQKTRRQKTLPPRAFRSAVARRCGYFLEERYSFTTL